MMKPFTVDDNRLLLCGQEILTGPLLDMPTFARWLNEDVPPSMAALRDRLMQMIQVSRGGSFTMAPGLRNLPDAALGGEP